MDSDEEPELKEEITTLGRGIARTFKRDVIATIAGALIGMLIGLVLSVTVGVLTFWGWIKFGALLGAFLGLASRSLFKPLFDYDRPPKRSPDSKS